MATTNRQHNDDSATDRRSEKVRKIMGEIPPSLVRWGMAVILLILLALIMAVVLLPYPYSNGETILQHIL